MIPDIELIGQDRPIGSALGDIVPAQQKGRAPRSPWIAAIIRTLTWIVLALRGRSNSCSSFVSRGTSLSEKNQNLDLAGSFMAAP
jgi:hypothetical protein